MAVVEVDEAPEGSVVVVVPSGLAVVLVVVELDVAEVATEPLWTVVDVAAWSVAATTCFCWSLRLASTPTATHTTSDAAASRAGPVRRSLGRDMAQSPRGSGHRRTQSRACHQNFRFRNFVQLLRTFLLGPGEAHLSFRSRGQTPKGGRRVPNV